MAKNSVYSEDKIKTLDAIEHIRLRTGMYIGRKSDGSQYEDGIYILVKEVIDNSIDEFIMGYGKRVTVSLNYDTGEVTIRDYGRGIPLGKVVDCVSQMNTGGKYNDDVFQYSVGLNGVGTKAVNALSIKFYVRSVRDGEFSDATFERGKLKKQNTGKCTEKNGTLVTFTPDEEIFPKFRFRQEHLERRMRMYAYLNAGLAIDFNEKRFVSDNGLMDLIHDEARLERIYQPLYFRTKMLEFAFTHTNRFNEDYYSFVNGQFTNDGGTHLSAFKEGLLKAVNEFNPKKKYDGDDVREGIVGAIAIRLKDPVFESQTKNKLGNAEIRSDLVAAIKKAVEECLHRNPDAANALLSKIEETAQLRQDLNKVKKLSRERAKAASVRVPQLKDCKHHYNKIKNTGLDSTLMIVEGNSAGGTIVRVRNADNEAIFCLRGKPLNVCGLKRDELYKNKELYNLMQTLGIEHSLDSLRYNKVIIATDADVDGLHIRMLMITFFLRFFEQIVRDGHVFILETPLFRVRNKKETHYCYTEEDRIKAMAACGKNPEITRFKGLGEIDASEFKHFIGKDIRLTPVDMTQDIEVPETIEFFMGKNTPERYNYIMGNLVCDAEATQ